MAAKHNADASPPATGPAGVRVATGLKSGQNRPMSVIARTVALLLISNLFMTFAWDAHLRNLAQRPWLIAALASWGIALFEYLFQVPTNRLGHTSGATQDPPGGHHAARVRALRLALYGRARQAQLSMGRAMPVGGARSRTLLRLGSSLAVGSTLAIGKRCCPARRLATVIAPCAPSWPL